MERGHGEHSQKPAPGLGRKTREICLDESQNGCFNVPYLLGEGKGSLDGSYEDADGLGHDDGVGVEDADVERERNAERATESTLCKDHRSMIFQAVDQRINVCRLQKGGAMSMFLIIRPCFRTTQFAVMFKSVR